MKQQRCAWCGQLISKPRSIGDRSQNSRIFGNCASISFQLNERLGKIEWTPTMVYNQMKRRAVLNGVYPGVEFEFNGIRMIEPMSQSLVTSKEDQGLIDTIKEYADVNEIWLIEYMPDNKTKYKSIGGRTFAEMQKDFPEVNK